MRSAEYLNERNIDFRIITLAENVHTAPDVATACKCSLAQVLKSLVFIHKEIGILALIPGDLRVDAKKLADLSGVPSIRLASSDDVLKFTGYEIGTVSPFGLDSSVKRVMDQNVLNQEKVLVGSGERNKLLEVDIPSLERIWDGLIGDFSLAK